MTSVSPKTAALAPLALNPDVGGRARPSAEYLLTTPLPTLFNELGIELFESNITDDGFFGAVVVMRDGGIILSMPAGRSSTERKVIAYGLLGHALGISLPPLPDSVESVQLV